MIEKIGLVALLTGSLHLTFTSPSQAENPVCDEYGCCAGNSDYSTCAFGPDGMVCEYDPGGHTCPLSGPIEDAVNEVFHGVVDPLACSILAPISPPDGDVPPVWDCPPYGS